jgi:hypothetical protein
MEITGARYYSMRERMKRKGLPPLPFTLDEFRDDILSVMGGREDGAVECRYCKGRFSLDGIAVDHANPLSRGGSTGLNNIDYPCKPCNDKKGSLTLDEFTKLLVFLEKELPLARQDILSRLEKSVKLAAGAFANHGIINDLRKSGIWGKAQKERSAKKRAKQGR